MGHKLYLECGSGISGDMFVGAMLDLGADQKKMEEALQSLPVDGFKTEITRVKKSGLDACDFNVILDHAHENHDHDMEYLHGDHHHAEHHHGHEDHHHDEHHHHEHRSPEDIIHIIGHASMTDSARELACKIVKILANAEAKAHGAPLEQVHFHEVGAVDSIVDTYSRSGRPRRKWNRRAAWRQCVLPRRGWTLRNGRRCGGPDGGPASRTSIRPRSRDGW